MKAIVLIIVLGRISSTAYSQESRVPWYAFIGGFEVSTTPNTVIKSAVGQVMVGSTQQPNDFITSGFLANPLLGGGVVGVGENEELPLSYSLSQNYPNPFNPSTTIRFSVGMYGRTSLRVYDVLGREVATLVDEWQEAGRKAIQWNAEGFASGVYFYRLVAGDFVATKRLLLLK